MTFTVARRSRGAGPGCFSTQPPELRRSQAATASCSSLATSGSQERAQLVHARILHAVQSFIVRCRWTGAEQIPQVVAEEIFHPEDHLWLQGVIPSAMGASSSSEEPSASCLPGEKGRAKRLKRSRPQDGAFVESKASFCLVCDDGVAAGGITAGTC